MTIPRNDQLEAPFNTWLRNQGSLRSDLGYWATSGPLIWSRGTPYCLIEAKRFQGLLKPFQRILLGKLDRALSLDVNYYGLWFLQFEKTSPLDGKIWMRQFRSEEAFDKKMEPKMREIDSEKLVEWLKLYWTKEVKRGKLK